MTQTYSQNRYKDEVVTFKNISQAHTLDWSMISCILQSFRFKVIKSPKIQTKCVSNWNISFEFTMYILVNAFYLHGLVWKYCSICSLDSIRFSTFSFEIHISNISSPFGHWTWKIFTSIAHFSSNKCSCDNDQTKTKLFVSVWILKIKLLHAKRNVAQSTTPGASL